MSESQPQKRQRRNSDADQRIRSAYWFKDGNIVLQAENTLFRVHQSILSRHSQVFEHTFAIPQPPSQQDSEWVDGCPLVQLSDTAEDLTNIISLLYDCDKTVQFGNKITAGVLRSMLRLGRKYLIAYLEQEALDRLRHHCPTTLDAWDSRGIPRIENVEGDETGSTDAQIISIAHEFRLFTILPAAYARYLTVEWLVASPSGVEYIPSFLISLNRRISQTILIYQPRHANIALLAMPGLWDSSWQGALMHFVLRSFQRQHASANANRKHGTRSKIYQYGELRSPSPSGSSILGNRSRGKIYVHDAWLKSKFSLRKCGWNFGQCFPLFFNYPLGQI